MPAGSNIGVATSEPVLLDGTIAAAEHELRSGGIAVERDVLLAPLTTYRLGGPAELLVTPRSVREIQGALEVLGRHGVPLAVVGGGSNLLVSDDGFRGAVLTLGEPFREIEFSGTVVRVGAGRSLGSVVSAAQSRGLAGLECAAGIPGTIGGAVAMNAGSRESWIGSVVQSVTYVTLAGSSQLAGELVTVPGNQVEWGYRTTDIRDRAVVVEVVLELAQSTAEAVGARIRDAIDRRRGTQPVGTHNAGSVFRNPDGDSAGRLIEAAGLKGLTAGGASVSEVHANFIVAQSGATASDVYGLVHEVQRKVGERFGVELTPEIRFIGRF